MQVNEDDIRIYYKLYHIRAFGLHTATIPDL